MRTEDHPVISADAPATHLASRLATALATRDADTLLALFGSEVDFRALTPGRFWQASSPDVIVREIILGAWFEPTDVVRQVEWAETVPVAGRTRLGYRLRVTSPGGNCTVEQQAYVELTGGRITWLRLVCSGFIPNEPTEARQS